MRPAPSRRCAVLTAVLLGATLLSGCGSPGYYWQSVRGHLALLSAARPVDDWLADPATPAPLRERLGAAREMRDFAVRELALPDNASYRRYAALGRPAAVWNVVATPELSLELKTWCFPVVGCVGYRGYFDRADAEAEAAALRAQGWETYVYGVPAYSTLGKLPGAWFADPLLDTFMTGDELALARLMFHELAHQVVYAPGDTAFNESYATAVERLGSELWLARRPDAQALRERGARADALRADFRALVQRHRQALQALYASAASEDDKRRGKAAILAAMRAEHAALKAGPWGGDARYDRWFETAGNPQLAIQAAYADRVGDFERLHARLHAQAAAGETPVQLWRRFHAQVQRLADLPDGQQRQQALRAP